MFKNLCRGLLLSVLTLTGIPAYAQNSVVVNFVDGQVLKAAQLNVMQQGLVPRTLIGANSGVAGLNSSGAFTGPLSGNTRTGGSDSGTDISAANLSADMTGAEAVAAIEALQNAQANFLKITDAQNTYAPISNPTFTGTVSGVNLDLTGSVVAGSLSGEASTATAITNQGTTPATLADHYRRPGIYPDDFYETADGTDDAPSIQRALTALSANNQLGGRLLFKARIYTIASAISQTNQAWWSCSPGHMTSGGEWSDSSERYGGTWFHITTAFKGSTGSPITISTGAAIGSGMDNCAFYEDQPASTNNVQDGTYTWAPYSYPFIVNINKIAGDYTIYNSLWRNISTGIYSDGTGRITIDHALMDIYNTGIEIHHSYDVDRITDVHFYPVGGEEYDVMNYRNSSAVPIKLFRVDTPFLDRIFALDVVHGIEFDEDSAGTDSAGNTIAGGVPTKVTIGAYECDGTHYCIYNNASGSTMKIANLGTQGGNNTLSTFSTWTDSAAIYNEKYGMQEIGNIHAQALGGSVIYNADSSSCGWASVSSILLDNSTFAVNSSGYISDAVSCDSSGTTKHSIYLANPPERFYGSTGTIPTTYQPSTSEGLLYWSSPSNHP